MVYSFLLEDPKLLDIIQKEFDRIGIVNEEKNRLIVFYTVLGAKLLDEPPNTIFQGASSSGKSLVSKGVIINFPKGFKTEEAWTKETKTKPSRKYLKTEWLEGFGIVPLNNMTMAGLYRIGLDNPTFFDKKLIFQGELPQKPSDEQIRVQQIIRQLLSEGEVNKNLVMGDKSVVIYLKGRPGFISCDATFKIDDQLLNRTLLLNPDEGASQTTAILKKQGLLAEKPWLKETVMVSSVILSKIHEQLEPFQVLNLWGRKVSQFLGKITSDPRVRRTNPQILRFIELRTLLFQKQREIVYRKEHPEVNYLLTTREDVIETMILLSETIFQTLIRILETSLKFLSEIKNKNNKNFWEIVTDDNDVERLFPKWFTYNDFAEFNKTHSKSVYQHLKSLCDSGLLLLDDKHKQHRLKLNIERKTPLIGSDFLRDNLMDWFPEKPLPDAFESMSMRNSQNGQILPKKSPADNAHRLPIGDTRNIVKEEQEEFDVLEES